MKQKMRKLARASQEAQFGRKVREFQSLKYNADGPGKLSLVAPPHDQIFVRRLAVTDNVCDDPRCYS